MYCVRYSFCKQHVVESDFSPPYSNSVHLFEEFAHYECPRFKCFTLETKLKYAKQNNQLINYAKKSEIYTLILILVI